MPLKENQRIKVRSHERESLKQSLFEPITACDKLDISHYKRFAVKQRQAKITERFNTQRFEVITMPLSRESNYMYK